MQQKRRRITSTRNEESQQLGLCTICNNFIPVEMIDEHCKICFELRQNRNISSLNEISKQLSQIQYLCQSQMKGLMEQNVKFKQLSRICDICILLNQLNDLNSITMKIYSNLDAELNILSRLSTQSASVQIFISRIQVLIDEKLSIINKSQTRKQKPLLSPQQSISKFNSEQLCIKSYQKTRTQHSEYEQSYNTDLVDDRRRKFSAKYMQQKIKLDAHSPAHQLKVNDLYQRAMQRQISPREWDFFIIKNFAAAERAVDYNQ